MHGNTFVSQNETIILFDMDGTLTSARKKIGMEIITTLRVASTHAKIGIVTGSPIEYINQQLSDLWGPAGLDPRKIILMPCNGTQAYAWNSETRNFARFYHTDFKDYLSSHFESKLAGNDAYTCMIKDLLELELDFLEDYAIADVSGNFVSYRDSLVNWSMIGRDASDELRSKFEVLDSDYGIREKLRNSLRVRLDTSGLAAIDCSLGGTTSIDIYPGGWDKTHCLRHVEGADIWFWGDRCEPGGNDHELYNSLSPGVRSFQVNGPQECIKSLRNHLNIDWEYADLLSGNLERICTVGSD